MTTRQLELTPGGGQLLLPPSYSIANLRATPSSDGIALAEVRDEVELLKLLFERGLELVGSSRGWISQLNLQTGELNIVDSRR